MSAPRAQRGNARSGIALEVSELALLPMGDFRAALLDELHTGGRASALFALPPEAAPSGAFELVAVVAHDDEGRLTLLRGKVEGRAFPSLTSRHPQLQAFEREIHELHALEPEGHPWLKPLRFHGELDGVSPPHTFFRVEGSAIHEVGVGPVHAGIIEPGHFRFQCQGEEVLSLEIQLGYQHRRAERLVAGAKTPRALALAEELAGDSSIAHAWAYCSLREALAGTLAPPRALALRALALELERLANHIGDLGALCNDVGYLPGASYFGRLRGEFLNLTLELCGNRFGRGLLLPGGVRYNLDSLAVKQMLDRLHLAARDCRSTAAMLFDAPGVVGRFEGTGALTRQASDELGLVGPAARACGSPRDTRLDHPMPGLEPLAREAPPPKRATAETGDVLGRAQVRWAEADASLDYVERLLLALPPGPVRQEAPPLRPGMIAAQLVEGWRGEVAHVALTNHEGALAAYKVVDPSFHNWFGLAMALRGNAISDFPLCNKSFNLSYCGHDL